MKKFDFKTQWNSVPEDGEKLSYELVTEPGQSFTTREIYERFLTTGRVMSEARVVYDEDELGREPDFSDFDVTQDGSFDLSDVTEKRSNIEISNEKRSTINSLSAAYATGKISFDEFCQRAYSIDRDYAQPFVEKFGKALAKNAPSQGASVSE